MLLDLDEWGAVSTIRLAYGGVAATPLRLMKTEAALMGKPWTRETVEAVMPVLNAEVTPISDHRGSARYRSLLATNLLLAFFLESENTESSQLPGNPSSCAAWVG
jgi:xanthine dehydrogenase iron-sulfur cluster and FAD-binding subunit A